MQAMRSTPEEKLLGRELAHRAVTLTIGTCYLTASAIVFLTSPKAYDSETSGPKRVVLFWKTFEHVYRCWCARTRVRDSASPEGVAWGVQL
jgi:hypothetical protein